MQAYLCSKYTTKSLKIRKSFFDKFKARPTAANEKLRTISDEFRERDILKDDKKLDKILKEHEKSKKLTDDELF